MEPEAMQVDPAKDDLTPRNYQIQLMEIALKKNTIIFLPTGSGKTYIAILVLKRMSESLLKSYSDGGKISIILVNTVALVDQHARCLEARTNFSVGRYTGDMNLDFWPRSKWLEELNKYQVFIMTVQILVNVVNESYLDLNKVNLLIFDECHRGVNDQPMRQLCKSFETVQDPPRVLGLTATLLNGNCLPDKVMQSVRDLEITYHSQVATVDGLEHVVGFSTNPKERIKYFVPLNLSSTENEVIQILEHMKLVILKVKTDIVPEISLSIGELKPLAKSEGLKKLANNIVDLVEQIRTLGTYGGNKAVLAHMIQIERLKSHCVDMGLSKVLCYVQTQLICVRQKLEKSMEGFDEKERFRLFSSGKLLELIGILEDYRFQSKEELCGLIFTQRRFTAKVLNHILRALSESVPEYSFIKSNFMVGNSNNPYNSTRESLFIMKKNREVLQSFENKEINLLIASNVLEEGVDIPMCTLVVKFDEPLDYRSYIQSKGRARHKLSLYYMMVAQSDAKKFMSKYSQYQEVERILNTFLIGQNEERTEPSEEDVQMMYAEDEIAPYYTAGRNSAKVSLVSAIPLLNMYCDKLPHDIYTDMSPEYWYEEKFTQKGTENVKYTSITVVLPTVCPLLEPIKGPFMRGVKLAKRAAALKACQMLHKCGELDDHLVPRRRELPEDDISFLFTHYPEIKEPTAGNSKHRRIHKKEIPKCVLGPIKPNTTTFLHIITFRPVFERRDNINDSTMYDIYAHRLSFGVLTPNKLPTLCEFPIYVSLGVLKVTVQVNVKEVVLSEVDINDVKEFNVLVYSDVLQVLKPFLVFDTSNAAESLLLVPVDKEGSDVDYRVLKEHKEVKNVFEMTTEEKIGLEVTQETYLKKIVSPWYRDAGRYIVTEITLSKTPLSDFPNEDFATFVEYYKIKHNRRIVNTTQPLLLVKGLTKRMNFFKPQGEKRKRDRSYEETVEYMIPELVVKQEFPSSLWIQASFLPTVLTRLTFLLRVEELRRRIVKEGRLGTENIPKEPLELDEHLVNFEPHSKKPKEVNVLVSNINKEETKEKIDPSSLKLTCNEDYVQKMLEAEYPWKNKDEPKDIERYLDVTVMDIDYYENFIYHPVTEVERMKNDNIKKAVTNNQLALTYHKDFTPKTIKLLEKESNRGGPDLRDLYAAFASAHANDIVNLERLETLGDSFLKLITSIYISLRFPRFDEGQSTALKGRLVSNKNLYYLAAQKNFGGIMRYNDLMVHEWMPPCFRVPDLITKRIEKKEIAYTSLFHMNISFEEQVAGQLSAETKACILNEQKEEDETEEDLLGLVAPFFHSNYVGDKHVADTMEAAIGCYLESCGIEGAIKFVEWMGVIPPAENINDLLNSTPPNPVLGRLKTQRDIDFHIPGWQKLEETLGYHFKNRGYLLQALTHSSYTPNRITYSYEKLEFLGDAILDFLITCHIYETSGKLSPGELTDLRSALVNNNTFASLAVRCNFQKSMLLINATLQSYIDRFVKYIESKNYEINDEVLILLEEDDVEMAEYVDVPKVLGDLFEALAGAVYLDSGKDLNVVWQVFYKIMWREIDLFSANVPKNVVRRLYEWMPTAYPEFGKAQDAGPGTTMVPLSFMLDGHLKRVYGFGSNKTMAKKAAAKLALRLLEK